MVLIVAEQMITNLQEMHSLGYCHRDMKPANIMYGVGEKHSKVYLIDFGLSKTYWDDKGEHIPFRDGLNLTGTSRYVSMNTHAGFQKSRRDDMEELGYVLMQLLIGDLPWAGGLGGLEKLEMYAKIKEGKQNVSLEELTKGFPIEFAEYIKYCRELGYS